MKNLKLMNGTKIIVPEEVDISKVGYFDEMEYELWDTIKGYMAFLGILLENPAGAPDWATVKAVQDKIVQVLQEAGVNFKTEATSDREVVNTEFPVVLLDTDIECIMYVALDDGITHWCTSFSNLDKASGDGVARQCTAFSNLDEASDEPYKELTRNRALTLTDDKTGNLLKLTKEAFISGFQQYLKQPTSSDILEFIDHQLRVDLNTIEPEVADAIIQYALFGKIQY